MLCKQLIIGYDFCAKRLFLNVNTRHGKWEKPLRNKGYDYGAVKERPGYFKNIGQIKL